MRSRGTANQFIVITSTAAAKLPYPIPSPRAIVHPRLNIGGHLDCAPHPLYWGFVCVGFDALVQHEVVGADEQHIRFTKSQQQEPEPRPFFVQHDLMTPIPLADNTISGALSEHFFEVCTITTHPNKHRTNP